jgi:hypothetical protein
MASLFVRDVDPNLAAGLKEVGFLADLPQRTVVEAVTAIALGEDHPHKPAIARAIRVWKRSKQE